MEYGYARVSTREQNERRQLAALQEFGVTNSRIYVDKQSGKNFGRSAYRRLLGRLRQGDTLVIKSIDRLGRNYEEILENSGGSSPRRNRRASWCWACPCWTPARAEI